MLAGSGGGNCGGSGDDGDGGRDGGDGGRDGGGSDDGCRRVKHREQFFSSDIIGGVSGGVSSGVSVYCLRWQ